MSIDFTVAVCTHNGAERLPNVLRCLHDQIGVDDIRWEVLVIDNNSSDSTALIARSYQLNWSDSNPLRYFFEPKLGLANARQRAIAEAQGEFVGFLDDDNHAEPNWVAAAIDFGRSHPKAGAYGSRIFGKFEGTPPENFEQIAPLLAIIDRGEKPRFYEPRKKVLPPGAGLVFRRQAWLENVPEQCFLQGRASGYKLPGEDLEVLLYVQRAGWEVWYNPGMKVHHQIPHWRLEKDYLMDLCRGIGLSRYYTRMLSFNRWQWVFMFPVYVANDLRKILTHFLKNRHLIQHDLVAACQMEIFVNSLISPFYLLGKYIVTLRDPIQEDVSVTPGQYETHAPSQH
jgi:glycosyltransferase involved in cell wall biosynthesis